MALAAPDPQAIVIFGASGDLTKKKILPALYNLSVEGLLPTKCAVIGYAFSPWSDEDFRAHAKDAVTQFSRTGIDEAAFEKFAQTLSFVQGKFDDPAGFATLAARLKKADADAGTNDGRLYYLATPPSAFGTIPAFLGQMPDGPGNPRRTRIVIEKPFGHDLASAMELTRTIHKVFDETQIFRIDHYLGKETVQNLMVFRFANSLWERVWNRDAIDHIQFTVSEAIGVEGRAAYYEEAGAIRDLIQNHMLQVLAFIAMEPPRSLEPEAFRDEKVKLLKTVHPITPKHVVRGQYVGYLDEPGVAKGSQVETFAAVELYIDNWRWTSVPFFLRHGKHLPERATEVIVVFKPAPAYLFHGVGVHHLAPDHLTIRIQPDEGISFSFQAKDPGPGYELQEVEMNFSYGASFKTKPAEAYERLIHDAMSGDHTLFTREDGVERAWQIVTEILEHPGPAHPYEPGTWGPKEADALIHPRQWHMGSHWYEGGEKA